MFNNPNHRDLHILEKLVFPAYVWQKWKSRIVQGIQKARGLVGLLAKLMIWSRTLFTDLDMPDSIGCHWDLPPNRVYRMNSPILPLPPMWRLTWAHISHLMIGIVWTDLGVLYQGASFEVSDLYQNIILLLDLLPSWTTQLCFEMDDYLMKIVKSPDTSHWMTWFQVRQISNAIEAKPPVNIISISCSLRMLLRKMKRVLPLPTYFSELE